MRHSHKMSVKKNLTPVELQAARAMHDQMLARLMEAPGDAVMAMHRLETDFGLSYWCQWRLRYQGKATEAFYAAMRRAYREVLAFAIARNQKLLDAINCDWVRQDDAATITEMLLTAEAYRMTRIHH